MANVFFCTVIPLAFTGDAKVLTYEHKDRLAPGQIVEIPLGRRSSLGVVHESVAQPEFKTKSMLRVLDLPQLPEELTSLASWMADYYAASPSSVWTTFLPAGLGKTRRPQKPLAHKSGAGVPATPLTVEQSAALADLMATKFHTSLIQGVTGSGKTRLYLELAARALAAGQSVIVLVPEITLTGQVVAEFERAFGSTVLSSHSKLTEAKRHSIWSEAFGSYQAHEPRIVVGPRSCLFMPLYKLGLVIIDECHEPTYKQEQHPKYQATVVGAKRGALTGAKLVLGSATPGLTELFLARIHRIELVKMIHRVNEIPHAEAEILDLRDKKLFRQSKIITQPLLDSITQTVQAGRQTLLYLNRRGSASSQVCGDCGHITNCPNCALPLTFHADLMRLLCHHCNFRQASPAVCPACGGMNLKLLGGGTKKVEAEIERLYPTAKIARLDRDSATLPHIESVLRSLRNNELDIVIGTQMIAKGLDFPSVDTVGVIGADTMLHLPDFTAAERTYQLLSQVSGRAGRGDRAGRIFIQTYTPSHPAIVAAALGRYDEFADKELAERSLLQYPPYVFLLKLAYTASTRDAAQSGADAYATALSRQPGVAVIGPAPAFIEQSGGKFHWVITVKAKDRALLREIALAVPPKDWTADLDPGNLL
jgi:primosomal protein N' (replication factor Y) (superfamily II helicase)